MIQILTYGGKAESFKGKDVEINSIHDAKSLDEFDINVIQLYDSNMWKNRGSEINKINSVADLKSIGTMINNSVKTNIIVLLPKNINYYYHYSSYNQKYEHVCELKNMISQMRDYILSHIYMDILEI